MGLMTGCNRRYIEKDLKYGTLIAYLVKHNDKDIDDPLGRILIKPYLPSHITYNFSSHSDIIKIFKQQMLLYTEGPAYVDNSISDYKEQPNFIYSVKKFIIKNFNAKVKIAKLYNAYSLIDGLYDDIGKRFGGHELFGHPTNLQTIDNMIVELKQDIDNIDEYSIDNVIEMLFSIKNVDKQQTAKRCKILVNVLKDYFLINYKNRHSRFYDKPQSYQ